jgi:hypothetical protein
MGLDLPRGPELTDPSWPWLIPLFGSGLLLLRKVHRGVNGWSDLLQVFGLGFLLGASGGFGTEEGVLRATWYGFVLGCIATVYFWAFAFQPHSQRKRGTKPTNYDDESNSRQPNTYGRLGVLVALASIPAAIAVGYLQDQHPAIAAVAMVVLLAAGLSTLVMARLWARRHGPESGG